MSAPLLVWLCGCHSSSKPPPRPPHVSTALVVQRDVPIYVDAIGQAITPQEVQVRPQVQGQLLEAYVQQGAIVKEGDLLYIIDPRPYQALLDQAQSQMRRDLALLEIAEKTVERYKQVIEEDFISALAYEQYESNAQAAKAQVELDRAAIAAAQLNVDFCRVLAPVSGKISSFNVNVGNILTAYDVNFLTIIRPFNPIDISFSLPQQQFEMIRAEQGNEGFWPFVATLPEKPQVQVEGKTYFIDNAINQNTGTILLKGRCANQSWDFWPGEFVRVKVLKKIAQRAFMVPPGAVLMGRNGPYLYVVGAGSKATVRNVAVLTRTDDYVAFESAEIKEGDVVIVDGQINIAPGSLVTATLIGEPKRAFQEDVKA